jgi:hypothetical protein
MHDVETPYPLDDKELLAIHQDLSHWDYHLQGNRYTTIYTHLSSLKYIWKQHKLSSWQWRYLEVL